MLYFPFSQDPVRQPCVLDLSARGTRGVPTTPFPPSVTMVTSLMQFWILTSGVWRSFQQIESQFLLSQQNPSTIYFMCLCYCLLNFVPCAQPSVLSGRNYMIFKKKNLDNDNGDLVDIGCVFVFKVHYCEPTPAP